VGHEQPHAPLPEFDDPPIIEVALTAAFDPLLGYTSAHAGLFWSRVANRFVKAQEQPPLGIPTASERPDVDGAPGAPIVMMANGLPASRVWLLSDDDTELVQIQPTSFIRNWRQTPQHQNPYPRYEKLRFEFERDFKEFTAFAETAGLGTPAPTHCEVTYVNHIVAGDAWTKLSEIHKVVKGTSELDRLEFLPTPEDRRCAANFAIRDSNGQFLGRLTVSVDPALRRTDMQPLLILTLTARGKPLGGDVSGVLTFFDVAHEWIVRGFADVTTTDVQRRWGRTR